MTSLTNSTIPALLKELEYQAADEIAIVFQQKDQDQRLTYAELVRRSAVYCRAFEQAGIASGEPVIIILDHRLELISAFFGAVLHGAVPAIMPFLTEKLSPERYRESLGSLIEITEPSALVTYRDFQDEIDKIELSGSSLRSILYVEDQPASVEWDWTEAAGLNSQPEDIVLLQHSSGTTGLQKGVALSHQAILNQLEAYSSALNLTGMDVIVSWLPLYHDMGLIAGFLLPILLRVKLVLMSPFEWVRAPYRLMRAVSEHGGTLTWLPNFAYNFCAKKIRDRDLEGVDLSTWRAVINCSEPMRWESHEMFLSRFESYGLQASALATCYAMAENVFAVTQGGIEAPLLIDEVRRSSLSGERAARPESADEDTVKVLSAGPPIANTEIRVIDDEGRSLPERAIGEIALRGDSLLSEYYKRPDLTAKSFSNGWYKTGDLGYMYRGELFITGRAKELIIVGGKNIYPQDLEAIVDEIPGVYPGRAVAFGIFNEAIGTEDVAVVAEHDEDSQAETDLIVRQIRAAIAAGSDVTARYIQIVERGWLIKTSSGKNARAANKEKFLLEFGT